MNNEMNSGLPVRASTGPVTVVRAKSNSFLLAYNYRPLPEIDPAGWKVFTNLLAQGQVTEEERETFAVDLRWNFCRAGTRLPKGYAPVYSYEQGSRTLTALSEGVPEVPALLLEMLPQYAKAVASTTPLGLFDSSNLTAGDIETALGYARDAIKSRTKLVFFTSYRDSLTDVFNALFDAGITVEALNSETSREETERILKRINDPSTPGMAVVVSDRFSKGVDMSGAAGIVHLDIPKNNPATVIQRQGRVNRVGAGEKFTYTTNAQAAHDLGEALNRAVLALMQK
jgi:hypothetical protein